MPSVKPGEMVESVYRAIAQSGGTAIYVSKSVQEHPRCYNVEYEGKIFSLWVYVWTLTHGGRKTLPDEYRIQMTTVKSPLSINPNGYTVLLGYCPEMEMFAGFDLFMHRHFTVGSPSVQINIKVLYDALQNGLAFGLKENKETSVGIRPDQMLTYILNASKLHEYGDDAISFNLLEKATKCEFIKEDELNKLSTERQKVITTVERYSRAAGFRKQVINAYEHRCAVTKIQLGLVEAAHILPVTLEESIDHVTNGLALSPTIHKAYDKGLLYIDEKYIIKINEKRADELRYHSLIGGMDWLKG